MTPFSKGLTAATVYYAGAAFVTWLTYFIWGHDYIHGPGLHHLVGFLALVVGAVWILIGVIRLFLNRQNHRNTGSLIIHAMVVGCVTTYFMIEINKETVPAPETDKADIITIYQDTSTNSASIVDGYGDTIMLQVGDSTVVDNSKEWINK